MGVAPGEELLAANPASLSTEVADYSSVPPAEDYSLNTITEANSNTVPATNQTQLTADSQEWDYGRKGGADFNMEAPILEEDVIRAGGLGARDGIDSFLPAALDATDYEENLKNAMEYEDVQPVREDEIPRPGVGFVKDQLHKMDGLNSAQGK